MGGSVRVIVRKKSGEVIPMTRHTNPLSNIVQNPRFFTDETWIDEYISKSSESDYDDTSFKLLQPTGYGIVVFDFLKKKILSSQGYTNLGDMLISSMKMDQLRVKKDNDWCSYNNATLLNRMGVLDITKHTFDAITYDNIKAEIIDCTIDDLITHEGNMFGTKPIDQKIAIDYTAKINFGKLGWELCDYDDDTKGMISVFQHMYDDGFKFTIEDLSGYQEELDDEDGASIKRIVRGHRIGDILND